MGYRKCLTGAILGLGLLVSVPAMGDQVRVVPMITVKEDYNDNIYFSATDMTRDFVTTISPGLDLEKNTERLKAGFIARLDQRLYADTQDLNALDQHYRSKLQYTLSPRSRIDARAEFIQDSSPDRDIETTGYVLNATKRNRQNYGVSGDYAITEKTVADLSYGYYRDKYEGFDNSQLDNVEANLGNLLFTHNLSADLSETRGRLKFGYVNYRFTDSAVDNYTTTVGVSRRISELWSVVLDVGARYTTSQYDQEGVSQAQDSSGYGEVGNAVISYKGETSNFDFSIYKGILPASGRNGASDRTGLNIKMSRKFAYEFSGFLNGGYILNDASSEEFSSQSSIDQQTLFITPGIRYDITRDMAIDASYTYTRKEYDRDTNPTAERNLVMVRIYYKYPILE